MSEMGVDNAVVKPSLRARLREKLSFGKKKEAPKPPEVKPDKKAIVEKEAGVDAKIQAEKVEDQKETAEALTEARDDLQKITQGESGQEVPDTNPEDGQGINASNEYEHLVEEARLALGLPKYELGLANFIMKRDEVVITTGIGMGENISNIVQAIAVQALQKRGYDPQVYEMNWESDESFEAKQAALREYIGRREVKFGEGISAGSTALLLLKHEGLLNRITTLCGWLQPENASNSDVLRILKGKSSSFGEAVGKLGTVGPLENPEHVLSFWTRKDERIPIGTGYIQGGKSIEIPGRLLGHRHQAAIGETLLRRGGLIAQHFNSAKA